MPRRMHQFPSRMPQRAPRRVRIWSTFSNVTTALAAGNGANVSLLADLTATASTVGMTVVRTILVVTPLVVPALNDTVTIGLGIFRQTDVADPATAGLVRATQTDLDWAWWHLYTAAPTFGEGSNNNSIIIDSRAKRKVNELNERYLLVLESGATVATSYRVMARTLVLMP